jgi:hypothetical protein
MESHRTPLGGGGTMGFHRDILLGEFSVTRKTTMYRSTIRLIVTALMTFQIRLWTRCRTRLADLAL